MSYNPYGNDGTAPAGSSGDGPPGPAQPWEPGEVLQRALEAFKLHWAPLVLAPVVAGIVFFVFVGALLVYMIATGARGEDLGVRSASLVLSVLTVIIYPYFEVGLLRMWLATARGETPDVAQVFSGFDRYPHMLTLRIIVHGAPFLLSTLALLCGFAGLSTLDFVIGVLGKIVTGAVWLLLALGLYYADFFVADTNLSAVDALKRAWLVTAPFRGQALLFAILGTVILTVSSLCCGLPFLAALPIVMVGAATVYLRLTGQASGPSSSAFGTGFAGGDYTPPPRGPTSPF